MLDNLLKRILKILLFGLALLLVRNNRAQNVAESTMGDFNVSPDYQIIVLYALVAGLLWLATSPKL